MLGVAMNSAYYQNATKKKKKIHDTEFMRCTHILEAGFVKYTKFSIILFSYSPGK